MPSAWGSSFGPSFGFSFSAGISDGAHSVFLPQPYGMTFDDWGSRVAEAFADRAVASPPGEKHWKDWACGLGYVPALTSKDIPQPASFDTWQTWADRFLDSVR